MPAQPSGNPNSRGSARLAVGKHDLQLAEHHVPILAPGVPMLHDSLGCQVQHPPQRIVVGKRRFVLGDLSELTIQPFDDVRRVYDFPNLGRIFKEGTQNFPVFLPTLDAGWILFPPFVAEGAEVLFCFLQSDRSVDLFQVSYQFLDVFVVE